MTHLRRLNRFARIALSGALAVFAVRCAPVAAAADDTATTVHVGFTKTRAADAPAPREPDEIVRETLGRLTFANVTLDADDRPVKEVLSALVRALQINFVPYYDAPNRPAPHLGVLPDRRITLFLKDVDGRAALEAIAAQCGPEVTWQLQRGMIEFGPRETLGREEARRTKVYDVTDLAHEAPYFDPAIATTGGQNRLRPKDVSADLVRMISEQCEPEAFRPEPPPTEDEIREGTKTPQIDHTPPNVPSKNPRQGVNSTATRNLDPDVGPVFVKGRWAQIQVKDATLIVTAPDFVHRAIDGYPEPIPPKAN